MRRKAVTSLACLAISFSLIFCGVAQAVQLPPYPLIPDPELSYLGDDLGLDGATCAWCGGQIRFIGFFLSPFTGGNTYLYICENCGRTSDGCQAFEGAHKLYNQCYNDDSFTSCRNWRNEFFVKPRGVCPVCGKVFSPSGDLTVADDEYWSTVNDFKAIYPGEGIQAPKGTVDGPEYIDGEPISTSFAITPGSIHGRVLNTRGRVISGACIKVNDCLMSTNPSGEFRFTLVYPGVYTVYYDAPGYIGQTQVIEVKQGQETRCPTCILSPGVVSSTTGSIYGRVISRTTEKMIPRTCIRIDNCIMPTNPGGEFRFTLVHPGVYTIYYDAPGYIGQAQVIEVKQGQETRCPTCILSK